MRREGEGMTNQEIADRIIEVSKEFHEIGRPNSTFTEQAATACLLSLAGAISEGGEAFMAFVDFCGHYSMNAIPRLEAAIAHEKSKAGG